jgi:TatD DNase family protein
MLIDAHCHLDDAPDAGAIIARAKAAGVGRLVVNGLWKSPGHFGNALELAAAHQGVAATIGIHPHDCAQVPEADWARCAERAADPRVVAVGETGLDFHYDHSPRGRQREALRWSIALARKVKKPLVVHVREADPDVQRILQEERAGEVGGQIHCFSGDRAAARAYLDLGFYLSFSGIVTFKSADEVRAAARLTPRDRLLVETDSPYLAPLPYRGRRNEPAFVVETAKKLAQVREEPFEELAEETTRNAALLFSF